MATNRFVIGRQQIMHRNCLFAVVLLGTTLNTACTRYSTTNVSRIEGSTGNQAANAPEFRAIIRVEGNADIALRDPLGREDRITQNGHVAFSGCERVVGDSHPDVEDDSPVADVVFFYLSDIEAGEYHLFATKRSSAAKLLLQVSRHVVRETGCDAVVEHDQASVLDVTWCINWSGDPDTCWVTAEECAVVEPGARH
jgi:hypothetical protein